MRTLLIALLFAFILIVTTLQADAIKEENEQRRKAKRHLLSETPLGRKANAGGSDTKDLPNKINSASANTNTADSINNNQRTAYMNDNNDDDDDDDDDKNDSYQNYGNGSGSSTSSHHIFVDARKPRPPKHG